MTMPGPPAPSPEMRSEGVPGAAPPRPESPLNESHFLMIRRARAAQGVVRKASRVAAWDAGITLTIGLAGILFSTLVSWSWLGIFITAGISGVGVAGLAGWDRMQDGNPSAATLLGFNQIVLMGLIVIYCVIQMATFSPAELTASAGSLKGFGDFGSLGIDSALTDAGPALVRGFYGLIILLTVCGQGGMAFYYFSRRRRLEEFRSDAPDWVRRLFRELNI